MQEKETFQKFKAAVLALAALALVVYLGKAYETPLRGIDSNIHATVSMNVTSKGFLPRLPMIAPNSTYLVAQPNPSVTGEAIFNDHPFFYFWLNGRVMRALGPSSWSARVLTALFAVGCVLLTVALGTALHSRLFGVLAGLFYLFSRDMILTGSTVSLDPAMLFFILLSFLLWRKKRWAAAGLAVGVGLWIKSPVVLLLYPTAFIVSIFQRRVPEDFGRILGSAVFALAVGSMVWFATGWLGNWDLVRDYWARQVWGTAIAGRGMGYDQDWFLFFKVIRTGFLPGLPFFFLGLMTIARKRLWKNPGAGVSFVAIAIVAIAITLMRFKLGYYYNPAFPFLAMLSAFSVVGLLAKRERRVYGAITVGTPLLLAVLVTCPISFGPNAFVALKRFVPLIQTYGTCEDTVYLVPGGEPVGSALDYGLVLNFNTGRKVEVAPCSALPELIQKGEAKWVILSAENERNCLGSRDLQKITGRYLMGSQILLTSLIPRKPEIDLTPLERENQPVLDCKPAPFKRDLYHRYQYDY